MILFPNNLGRELAEKLAFSLEKNQHLTKAKDAEMSRENSNGRHERLIKK